MKAKEKRRAITFRLNLTNEKENTVYEKLTSKEHGNISMSAYIKDILLDHFSNEDKEKTLAESFQKLQECQKKALSDVKNVVKEEMQNHDMRVLAVLASNGSYTPITPTDTQKKGKGMELPKESKELPEGMDDVLKMFQ